MNGMITIEMYTFVLFFRFYPVCYLLVFFLIVFNQLWFCLKRTYPGCAIALCSALLSHPAEAQMMKGGQVHFQRRWGPCWYNHMRKVSRSGDGRRQMPRGSGTPSCGLSIAN